MPLNTHLIIHWGGTLAGDDPDGKLFAKLRYLLDKRLRRKYGIPLTGIWVRERHRNRRRDSRPSRPFPFIASSSHGTPQGSE